jgi:hypothetical protein
MSELIKVNAAIEALAEKAATAQEGGHAMHFSQAALNLAQVIATLDNLNDNRN